VERRQPGGVHDRFGPQNCPENGLEPVSGGPAEAGVDVRKWWTVDRRRDERLQVFGCLRIPERRADVQRGRDVGARREVLVGMDLAGGALVSGVES
jgi:hypothetical protein